MTFLLGLRYNQECRYANVRSGSGQKSENRELTANGTNRSNRPNGCLSNGMVVRPKDAEKPPRFRHDLHNLREPGTAAEMDALPTSHVCLVDGNTLLTYNATPVCGRAYVVDTALSPSA